MNGHIGQNAAVVSITYIDSKGWSLIDYMFRSQSHINMFDSFKIHESYICQTIVQFHSSRKRILILMNTKKNQILLQV
jgi:hypothetical protein